jgi:hypothetical protein
MVTYHYVKFYVSIIIHLEVININVIIIILILILSFRGSKGVGVTIESYGKIEISYINVDNF